MGAWVNELIPNVLGTVSLLGLLLVFLGGIATSFGPCNLSMVPIIIAYVGGSESGRRRSFLLSFLFTLGTATTFMLLGLLIASFGGIFGTRKSILYFLVSAVCLAVGLNLLGVFSFNISFGGNLLSRLKETRGPIGSYFLGLVMGLVGSQCGTPVLLAILSLAMASGKWLYGAVLLFIYALGRGVPLILVGTFTGLISRMETFARLNDIIEKAAGIIIIMVGAYFVFSAVRIL